jgi:predicted Rossmann fold nucleotide-binding protein DprA/Smf involved in DNA uptake
VSASTLAADSRAITLLCSRVGLSSEDRLEPLSVDEWNHLVDRLKHSGWKRPRALVGRTAAELRHDLGVTGDLAARIAALMGREEQAAVALKQLAARGIWVRTRVDAAYPARLKQRLGRCRPTVLFGAGPLDLLSHPGIAMVGSRDLDPAGETFARAFAMRCAADDVTVISGGARGADRVSMLGALEAGGRAVGVLAHSLEQALHDRGAARFVHQGRLTLMTPFHPSAGFSVNNAMARNALIYCLAELSVVVSSAEGSGGTWHGATENLEHGWAPLFVRAGASAPAGNRALLNRGGIPLSADTLPPNGALLSGLHEQASAGRLTGSVGAAGLIGAEPAPSAVSADGAGFDAVWPRLASFLLEPRSEQDVAEAFDVELSRAREWLAHAAREQRVEVLPKRPRRYRQAAPRLL